MQAGRSALVAAILSMVLLLQPEPARAHHPFGGLSGFVKARERHESIRVCAPQSIDGASVIAPWNELAGWGLFLLACDEPDITFIPDSATWVQAAYLQSFTYCRVHYSSVSTTVHQHEIGHCLGFADHVPSGHLHQVGRVNPDECAGYGGVMSYCDWGGPRWFGDDDREMLVRAGYAAPAGTEDAGAPAVASPPDRVPAGPEASATWLSLLRRLVEFLLRWR